MAIGTCAGWMPRFEALSKWLCSRWQITALACVAFCATLFLTTAVAQTQQYIYDEAGNVVEIRRLAAGELAILQFAPVRGPIGATVTIHGQGFHATLGSNTVRFNGVVASLVSGSTTQLVATVPAGATSGAISVSNGTATVNSSLPFTITTGPTITNFAPTIGTAGTAVTITGTNYDALPINNRVSFAGTAATTAASTTTSISTTVPTAASSGRISVTTPTGTATSAADFFVPPTGVAPSSVGFTGRAVVDGAATPVSVTVGKVALLLVDANAGDTLTVHLDALSGGSVPVSIYGTSGTLLGSETGTSAQPWARMPALTSAGTFTLLLNGTSAAFSVSVRVVRAPRMTLDGAFVNSAITVANQPKRVAVSGIAGQFIGIGFTSPTLTPSSGYFTIEVLRPNVSALQTEYCYPNGDYCAANLTFPATGEYSLWIRTPSATTGSLQSGASSDVTVTLTAGTPYTLTTTRAGQNVRLSFAGTAGPSPAIEFGATTTNPSGQSLNAVLLKPDGSTFTSTVVPPAGLTWTLPPLPANGTYVLFVEPRASSGAKGAATVTSARITVEPGVSIAIDGAAASAAFATTGETARFVFTITAGQNLGLGFTSLTLAPPASTYANVNVYKPDGSLLTTGYCYPNGNYCAVNLSNVVAGQHSIVLQPISGGTGSVQAWLSTDTTGTLTIGTPVTISTTRAGQNARRTFAGTAGQLLRLSVSALSTSPASQTVVFAVLKPDGTQLTSGGAYAAPYSLDLPALPSAGTYTLFVDPAYFAKGAATLSATVQIVVR